VDHYITCSFGILVILPAIFFAHLSAVLIFRNLLLQAHFDAAISAAGGSIRSARVAKRKGPDGKPLSAGFGFVECSSEDVAKIAISKMQVQLEITLLPLICLPTLACAGRQCLTDHYYKMLFGASSVGNLLVPWWSILEIQ